MSINWRKQKRLLLLLIPVIWGALHGLFHSKSVATPVLIAHRGAAGLAPENTLAAVRAGLKQQADMIEIDVRRSADGVVLLMHNANIEDTTNGTGAVVDLEWSALQTLDAGSRFALDYANEPIPTLAEILALIKTTSSTLLIEVKDPATYPGIEHDLLELIQQANAQQQVIVISFDQVWLAQFHALAPDIPVGALAYWPLEPSQISEAKMVGVFWPALLLDPTLVYRLHNANHLVFTYTLNNPQMMQWLLALGVDGIITDRPDRGASIVR